MPSNAKSFTIDLATGLAVGLAATYVMTRFQNRYGRSIQKFVQEKTGEQPSPSSGENATEQVADSLYQSVTHRHLSQNAKAIAGGFVHYGFGASMALAYTVLTFALGRPGLKTGLLFGTAVWAFADELGLWRMGYAKAPTEYPPSTHIYSLVSHAVYGGALGITSWTARKLEKLVA